MEEEDVTVMFIGDTGSGKSSMGNMFLGKNVFEVSDNPNPCTFIPKCYREVVNGRGRKVIDTEGFNDGHHVSEDQIHRLAEMLKNCDEGINAVGVVIQGTECRFTKGVRDVIKFIYDAFGSQVLSHLCIIFTFCSATYPDRKQTNIDYKKTMSDYLAEISGLHDIPSVPIFYVNCAKPDQEFVKSEMTLFYGWASMNKQMRSHDFEEAQLGYRVEEEEDIGHSLGMFDDGDNTIEKFVDRKRMKLISNDGTQIHYRDWVNTKKYSKLVIQVLYESRKNQHHCFEYKDGKKYEIFIDQVRKITINHKTGQKTESPWGEVNRRCELVSESSTTEEIVDETQYEACDGGFMEITYKKKRSVNVDENGKPSFGEYVIVPGTRSEKKIDVAPRIEYVCLLI